MSPIPDPVRRVLRILALLGTAVFFPLHFLHLAADFPNFSPWMDWSKYTDEGWYGDAAIRHFQLGHWYVPGDFNPAAALPVWPFLEALLFHFTGVSLIAVRALTVTVFGLILLTSWLLLSRWSAKKALAPDFAVLLLVVSPFCFVFTRLAILEPLLILLTLASLLAAGRARLTEPLLRTNLPVILALGILLPAMVLTKTTALFLVPAIAFLLWATLEYRLRPFLRVGLPAAALALLLWLCWFGLVVRPHYLLDYRYLFSANAYTGITLATASKVLQDTFTDGTWMGTLLFYSAMAALVVSLCFLPRLRRYPLIPTLILWAVGYAAFLAYHDNLQPRYYLVIAVPLTLLLPLAAEQLLIPLLPVLLLRRLASAALVLLVATLATRQAAETITYLRHPQYTLLHAFQDVHDLITEVDRADPAHHHLVLSISGSDLSLMTGLPSICDDFGTLELDARVARYRPGWYVAWNEIDDDKMEALSPLFHVERVAAFPAMDDPERNLLIVYRLTPTDEPRTSPHAHKPIPRNLRTRVGQQPSTAQLEH